ncbi:hypothetical protein N7325_21400, partial [Stutzerimonas stutzeri]|uniref:hypothetical protein n=1 Tax=Stutzerimonas stutzeri TaxID=316 RepID=UPI00244C26A5
FAHRVLADFPDASGADEQLIGAILDHLHSPELANPLSLSPHWRGSCHGQLQAVNNCGFSVTLRLYGIMAQP